MWQIISFELNNQMRLTIQILACRPNAGNKFYQFFDNIRLLYIFKKTLKYYYYVHKTLSSTLYINLKLCKLENCYKFRTNELADVSWKNASILNITHLFFQCCISPFSNLKWWNDIWWMMSYIMLSFKNLYNFF